jgi:hypothetical protein
MPLPGAWQFWADTLVGAVPLGPVTCTSFTAQRILSGYGTGSVTVPSGSTALPPDRLLRLWSWRLWVYYAGVLVWGGVPTGITDDAGGTVSLTLTELPGYLAKRVIDTAGGISYSQAEQTAIAADLAAPLADIGVPVITSPGPGYLRDASFDYLGSTDRAQLLTSFAQQVNAPEFRADYQLDSGGRPQCVLRIAYPRVGTDTGLGLVVPGTAAAYQGAWDSDRLRTRTFATGALPDNAPAGTSAPVVVVDAPQADLPRLDAVDDWQDVTLASVLTDRASTAAMQYAAPVETLTGSVHASLPALGSYGPGDDVAISITDPLLPGGLVTVARLTQMDIDAVAGTVALTCSTVLPPPKPRDTLIDRLRYTRVELAMLSHRNLAPLGAQADDPGGNP